MNKLTTWDSERYPVSRPNEPDILFAKINKCIQLTNMLRLIKYNFWLEIILLAYAL